MLYYYNKNDLGSLKGEEYSHRPKGECRPNSEFRLVRWSFSTVIRGDPGNCSERNPTPGPEQENNSLENVCLRGSNC
jgi:hypothetical protein